MRQYAYVTLFFTINIDMVTFQGQGPVATMPLLNGNDLTALYWDALEKKIFYF